MDNLRRLEELFAHFPGIGPRQAKRFVYYLLNKPASFTKEFTKLVEEVKKATAECDSCHRFFARGKQDICPICSDSSRDHSTLMVVARDSDFETIEKSGAYHGLYFVLGGTIPLLDKEPDKRIRLEKLLQHVSRAGSGEHVPVLKEIILSMNTTPDGEHTGTVVKEAVQTISAKNPALAGTLKITLLGRGLSTGAELEYVDGETIKNALENRG